MKSFLKFLCAGSLSTLLLAFPTPGWAQPEAVEGSPVGRTATDLRIAPRYTIDYNSSGGGYDGFGGLEVFLPLQQEPGRQVSYVVGRLALTNGADVGGNLQLGYRQLGQCRSAEGKCVFGSYLSLDLTNTGAVLFPQLGLGVEMLGDLDVRVNAYIPLGDTRRQTQVGQFVSPTSIQFRGHNLFFLDFNHSSQFETALNGVEVEIGGKLSQLGNGGDLRGYGGFYNYGGEGVERYWGGRFRVEARPTSYLNVSGGVQFDSEFGTLLLFRIAATLPAPYQRQDKEPTPVVARLSEPLGRLNSVVVAEQVEPAAVVAINSATGRPYRFMHVAPQWGKNNGSGGIKDPTKTVAAATAANGIFTVATDIIYVQPGNAGGAFTIPDGVAVLSVAPVQVVQTQFGPVQLPGSGQGHAARPVIADTVTMGNSTALSGFVIRPPVNQSGILVRGSNVEISANDISVIKTTSGYEPYEGFPFGFAGILVRSDAQVRNNEIPGIITITGNTVSATGSSTVTGIDVSPDYYYFGFFPSNNTVTIAGNTVSVSASGGDYSSATGIVASSANSPVTIVGNTVNATGHSYASGISGSGGSCFRFFCGGGGPITIADNTVSVSVRAQSDSQSDYSSATGISGSSYNGPVTITNNRVTVSSTGRYSYAGGISGSRSSGWFWNSRSDSPLTIAGNRVSVSASGRDSGSATGVSGSGDGPVTITDNTVSATGSSDVSGISGSSFSYYGSTSNNFLTIAGNTVTVSASTRGGGYDRVTGISGFNANRGPVTISDNTVSASGSDSDGISNDIFKYWSDPTSYTITGNTIEQAGRDGVRFELDSGYLASSPICIALSNNVSQNPGSGIGYHLMKTADSTFQIVDSSPTFTNTQANNIGTFVFEPDISSFTNVPACP